jgi:hypothetical protein
MQNWVGNTAIAKEKESDKSSANISDIVFIN